MANSDLYWNPILETLPQDKLRELHLRKFRKILAWAYEKSPFYHELYKNAGLEPGDIKTYDDIRKVPKMEKSFLRDAQNCEPFPYGKILAVPLEDVAGKRKLVPLNHPWIEAARHVDTSLGD